MKIINEAHEGKCEVCGKVALLDKGYGKKWACETCYYKIGNHVKKVDWNSVESGINNAQKAEKTCLTCLRKMSKCICKGESNGN